MKLFIEMMGKYIVLARGILVDRIGAAVTFRMGVVVFPLPDSVRLVVAGATADDTTADSSRSN